MKELEVLVSLAQKLINLGLATKAEIYGAEKAIKILEEKLKEDGTNV
jgi:hypothetical protein